MGARPIVRNRSMASTAKIELIASTLCANSHDVEILSQGEVIESRFVFYRSLSEQERFHQNIPVHYSSALPIRRVNGIWSNRATLQLFKARHFASPYDLVIIYNLKGPQLACAHHAIQNLGIPVILEYEDDRFVDVAGKAIQGFAFQRDAQSARRVLDRVSACVAVTPHLLSQLPSATPRLLLRGVIGADIVAASKEWAGRKENIVLFSGTHIESNGVAQLIKGWSQLGRQDWELHITGYGQLTTALRQMAADVPGVVFHGLVPRPEFVRRMCTAKVCINPHQLSKVPGNVFAFKIIEYLGSGAHVITTPMGALENVVENGITYMRDNAPETIADTLQEVMNNRPWERAFNNRVSEVYGPAALARSLEILLSEALHSKASRPGQSIQHEEFERSLPH